MTHVGMAALLLGATVATTSPCPTNLAQGAATVPTYWDLEHYYAADKSLQSAAQAFDRAIPAGTSIIDAEKQLADVDVYCKNKKKEPDTYKCLLAHYALNDGSLDVTRWTIYLHTSKYKVDDIAVDRYLDFKPGL